MERVTKVESLQEIIAEMTDSAATSENTSHIVYYPSSNSVDETRGRNTRITVSCWLYGKQAKQADCENDGVADRSAIGLPAGS